MGTIGGLLMSIDDMFKNEEKKIIIKSFQINLF